MKKKFYLLFLFCFAIIFGGLLLCRIVAALIYGLADGTIASRLAEIDFLAQGILALIITILYFALCFSHRFRKRK